MESNAVCQIWQVFHLISLVETYLFDYQQAKC